MTNKLNNRKRIVAYLAESYRRNPQAEVSGHELVGELGLETEVVRACLHELADEGMVEASILPVNMWVRLSEAGAQLAG